MLFEQTEEGKLLGWWTRSERERRFVLNDTANQCPDNVVTARGERQRRNVYRDWHNERPTGSDTRRAADLEVSVDLKRLIASWCSHLDWLSIGVDYDKLKLVSPIRFLPRHFDNGDKREEAGIRPYLCPADAQRKKLARLDFRVMGEEQPDLQRATDICLPTWTFGLV